MVKNRSLYYAGDFLKYGVDNFEEDMLDSMRDKTYSSFRHMYALANVVCCNIRSVYPESKNPIVKRNDLNVTISPRVKTENTASIISSHTADTDLENDWQFKFRLYNRLPVFRTSIIRSSRSFEAIYIPPGFSLRLFKPSFFRSKFPFPLELRINGAH